MVLPPPLPPSTPLRHQYPDCITASKFPDSCHPWVLKKSLFKWCRLCAPLFPTQLSAVFNYSTRVCVCVCVCQRGQGRKGWGGKEGLLKLEGEACVAFIIKATF